MPIYNLYLYISLLFILILHMQGQDTLSFQKFLDEVLQHHPLIQNAKLATIQTNKAYLLKARGQFDPKINYDLQNKFFNGNNYFLYYDFQIKQPTYPGIDFNLDYNYAAGMYLNNEQYIPSSGLFSVGASVPLLRNLLYDERRYHLQSSKLFNKNSKILLNAQIIQTLYPIIDDYWNFYEKYNLMLLYRELVNASYQRYKNIINAFQTGENPAIDTLDAGNQYQNFLLSYQKSILDFQNARYTLSNHLYSIKDTSFVAEKISDNIVLNTIDTSHLIFKNPELQSYQLKIKQLYLEKKLRIEFLKPQINVKYNFLLQPFAQSNYYPLNTNNYKWGVDIYFPLLLRKERADLKLVNIKINQTKNELLFKTQQTKNKLNIYYNNYLTYYQQLQFALKLNKRYYEMLQAEIINFKNGESNTFTVNTREIYYLQSKTKVIELSQKYYYYLNWLLILQKYSSEQI